MTSLALLPDRIRDRSGNGPAGRLLASLQLERAAQSDCFVAAPSGGEGFRMFGGHLVAQAIVAAGQTVSSGKVHAIQATFLRAGDRWAGVTLQVQPLFDGRTYRVRQVTTSQDGEVLMTAVISFHDGDTDSPRDDARRTMPSLPLAAVGCLSPWSDQGGNARACPIELRREEQEGASHEADGLAGWRRTWFKAAAGLPEDEPDALLHTALVAYASDLTAMESAMVAAGNDPCSDDLTWATLSHSLWIHRTPRADRWTRCEQHCAVAGRDRALVHGSLIDDTGCVVASFSQEGAIRANHRHAHLSRAA